VGYRLRKFFKRNRGPVLAAGVVLLAVLAGIVGTAWGWAEALTQRGIAVAMAAEAKANEQKANAAGDELRCLVLTEKAARLRAEDNETRAEWRLYASHIASAQREHEAHNYWLFYHYLNQCRPDFRGWEHDFLYTLANQHQQTLRGHKDSVYGLAFSPDGKLLASAGRGHLDKQGLDNPGEVKLWDAASGRALRTLTGHTGNVMSVAFSPDSTRLASCSTSQGNSRPGEVKVWNAASGQEIHTLKGRMRPIDPAKVDGPYFVEIFRSVAFSPDGNLLASGSMYSSNDQVVKLWDVASGREIRTFKGHAQVSSIAFSPDGKRLASASRRTVKLWDVASGQEVWTLRAGTVSIDGIAFSPNGKLLASAGGGGAVIPAKVSVWDADSGKEVLTLRGHTDCATSVAFSPDGTRLATAAWDKTVKLWELASGKECLTLSGHTDFATNVAFSPDGTRLASASADRTVKLWNLAGTQGVLTLKGSALAFSADGKRLATSAQGDLKLWDVAIGQELVTLLEPRKGARGAGAFAFSPDGKHLAASVDGALRLWDAVSGQEIRTLMESRPNQDVRCMAFSTDGKRLAGVIREYAGKLRTDGSTDTVREWDTATGREICAFRVHTRAPWFEAWGPGPGNGMKASVAFSPDGKYLTVVDDWGAAVPDLAQKVWDADTGREVLTLKGHKSPVHAVAFSPDGKRLATATPRETKLWDTASGQEVLTFDQDLRPLDAPSAWGYVALTFSSDGTRLANARYPNTLKVWDAVSGQLCLTLQGHTAAAQSVAFSPGGRRLVSASADGTVKVWDAVSGQEVLTLRHSGIRSCSAVFSPDGKRLASTDGETIKIWDASKSVTDSADGCNDLAWRLATCAEPHLRNPARALELARRAVTLAPDEGDFWNTLGAAHYRAGNWTAAAAALHKSIDLRRGGNSFDWFFLALAQWQLGQKDEARKRYDQAVAWMTKYAPHDEDLTRVRAEAAELLGIAKKEP
jgi:WD40 repeat protein